MPAVYEHPHVVLDAEIDALGHANNLAYLAWMQAAALAHSAVQGWPAERYHELGAGWVVRSHQIEYLRPTFAGEAIVIRTWVLATAATDWAFVNYRTGQPTRVPAEIIGAFELVEDA